MSNLLSQVTLDCHIDIPWIFTKHGHFDLRNSNLGELSMVDFPRMNVGGLNAAFFALYLSDKMQDEVWQVESHRLVQQQIRWLKQQKGSRVVDNTEDACKTVQDGLQAIFLGLEGGRLIQEDLSVLEAFRRSGVRYLTATHNFNTSWADSATDKPYHKGLTEFGRSVVKKAGELGIFMDISHASDATAHAILAESVLPVIASHSACRALRDMPRNIPDDLIREVCNSGGVVHVPFAYRFVGSCSTNIIDHIDHIVQITGIDHVGIGSDLDGAVMCADIPGVEVWSEVVMQGLSQRGYPDEAIAKVSGGNTLRLLSRERESPDLTKSDISCKIKNVEPVRNTLQQ